MALAPDDAPWYRRFRMLLGIYLLAILFGLREYVLARTEPAVDVETEEWSRMADVVSRVNPADVDTDYLLAMEALKKGDRDTFVRHMELALLDKHAKHNEILLQAYAQHLFTVNADYRQVNQWLNVWRTNHPASAEAFEIPLGSGPGDDNDATALRLELESIDWVLRHEVRPPDDERPGWRVLVWFRPATEIDIREAVAAVSVLQLSPEQRSGFTVSCLTLENCQLVPR
jgi:hypothetical protein